MNKEETKKLFKNITDSKVLKNTIRILGVLLIALFIFQAGVFVGFHKASFGHDWDNNYANNFGTMHRGPSMMGSVYDRLPNAHGAIGKIIKAELPTIIVLDKDNTEKVILINNDTKIRIMYEDAQQSDLKVDSYVAVIGSPNTEGQIEAKFIRILPNPLK